MTRVLLFRAIEEKNKAGRVQGGLIAIFKENTLIIQTKPTFQEHVKSTFGPGSYRAVQQKLENNYWVFDTEFSEFAAEA